MDTHVLERLDRLEAEQASLRASARRWRRAAVASMVACAGLGAVALTQPEDVADLIRAEQIEIVDPDGHVVAILGSDRFGGMVRVLSAEGEEGASMQVGSFGGFVRAMSPGGRGIAALDITPEGMPLVDLYSSGQLRARLAIDPNDSGTIVTNNGSGQLSVLIGTSDVGPGMVITHRNGEAFTGLSTDPTGRIPLMFVSGRSGANAVEIRTTSTGIGEVFVGNRRGEGRVFAP